MSKAVQDIKSGLKGIRGAGEAIRGGAMEATDQLFDQDSNHPQTIASQEKNRAIKEGGLREATGADRDIGSRHGPNTTATVGTSAGTSTGMGTRTGPGTGTAAPAPTGQHEYSSTRPDVGA